MTDTATGKATLPYGSWPSAVSARSLVAGVAGLSGLTAQGTDLYWLESRPEEGGRTVLMRLRDDRYEELTPAPFNVRSRVHEYGGGALTVAGDRAFFVNFADQDLHVVEPDGSIVRITHSDPTTRFADFCLDRSRNRLLAVVEQHHADREPENYLGAVDLATGALTPLATGQDFYAAPRLSPGGDRLAFIAWDHPNMPWDGTTLQSASLTAQGALTGLSTIAGGAVESVMQPVWQSDEALLFISDANGFWNLYRFDESGIYCVLEDGADYADPPWNLGSRSFTLLDDSHVLITRHGDAGAELVLVNTETTLATPFLGDDAAWQSYASLTASAASDGTPALYFIGSYADRSPTIERLLMNSGQADTVRKSGGVELNAADVSRAEPITYPTRDGLQAHAFYYPPTSATCQGSAGERAPLLVMSHGGPTSATGNSLSLRVQYYTTRGWGVLDVNYRGSSGYGRAYRNALNGRWGELDVTDCEDGVRYLTRTGRIDPERIAIRGGSAGGFTTLAALTTTDCFRAGASHYGIGDLHALARDTHKFESRYLDGLLGSPEMLSERSPINHLDRFRCPVIFFQGSEDKVVPPNQSQSMADALRAKDIPVAYLEFTGEGHGFRDAENIIRAVESEYGFFCRVFGIQPAEQLPEIHIDNAGNL